MDYMRSKLDMQVPEFQKEIYNSDRKTITVGDVTEKQLVGFGDTPTDPPEFKLFKCTAIEPFGPEKKNGKINPFKAAVWEQIINE
jgi:hypothetical protein